ncbi:Myeloid leukemia factor 1 [Trebouxia sp. C0009 RCD-2024]
MFGRGSVFDMLGVDFTRDPFFQDPFRHLHSQAGFPDPAQHLAAWSSASVPHRGREVPIETSSSRSARRSASQSGFIIEEVDENVRVPQSSSEPLVQEPDEGHAPEGRQRPSRMQQPLNALANPIQSFLDNPFQSIFGNQAFGGPDPFDHAFFGNPTDGNMIFQTTSSFAQHGPDGVQYSQSHSYGPKGVAEHQRRVKDGRTGEEEMTISRHLKDKGRTVTKRRQADGSQSQQQRLHNLPEAEANHFDEEWTYEAEKSLPMYMRGSTPALPQASRSNRPAVGYRS